MILLRPRNWRKGLPRSRLQIPPSHFLVYCTHPFATLSTMTGHKLLRFVAPIKTIRAQYGSEVDDQSSKRPPPCSVERCGVTANGRTSCDEGSLERREAGMTRDVSLHGHSVYEVRFTTWLPHEILHVSTETLRTLILIQCLSHPHRNPLFIHTLPSHTPAGRVGKG